MATRTMLMTLILAFPNLLAAQEVRAVSTRSKYSPLQTSEVVRKAKEDFDWDAIVELGIRKDPSTKPVLRDLAETTTNLDGTRFRAKLALAQMDDRKYFDELTRGLGSSDDKRRTEAIYRLGRIGTKHAVRLLIPILDDKNGRHCHVDVCTSSFNISAADSLSVALPDVEKKFVEDSGGKGYVPIPSWKEWWKKNQEKFKD